MGIDNDNIERKRHTSFRSLLLSLARRQIRSELQILPTTSTIYTIICLLVPAAFTVIPQLKTIASNIAG